MHLARLAPLIVNPPLPRESSKGFIHLYGNVFVVPVILIGELPVAGVASLSIE
ncbi:hypothetical protein I544_4496 [Mycobacteroides abscessus subsp. bolletii 103]|nr:hypothetical protein I544_4496 [Mycobacteroides abscessus subsp. bolletii 103]